MKLLLDENLSPRLVALLSDLFPSSAHVRDIGHASAPAPVFWQHAALHGLTMVSKDEDFHHLSFLRGAPPKVIGIHLGNCPTKTLEHLLHERHSEIKAFGDDPAASSLVPP